MAQSYYIFRSGRLRRKQNNIYLEYEGDDGKLNSHPIPVENIRDLYLFGEIDLNTKLLSFLAQNEIPVHCFNYYGFYVGTFYPREINVSGHLLVRQVEYYLDPKRRLAIAKEFVSGALHNIRRNLNYYRSRGKVVGEAIKAVEISIERLEECQSVPEIMREEGEAREAYYKAFNEILELEQPFEKRVRRPPDNMVNALLSLGNSLLYTATLSEIYVTQLNPAVSYLHEPSKRRFSLALDLSEVFKPLVVDRTVFRVINKGIIEEEDFEAIGEAKGVYLKDKALKRFIQEFESSLGETIKHRKLGRHVSYRQLIRLEAYKLIRHLLGMETYKAFRIWW